MPRNYQSDALENYLISGMGVQGVVNRAKREVVTIGYRKVKDHFGLDTTLSGVNVGGKVAALLDMLENECGVSKEKLDKFCIVDPIVQERIIQGFHIIKIDVATYVLINSQSNYVNYYNTRNGGDGTPDRTYQTDVYLYFFGRKCHKWFNRLTTKLTAKSEHVVTAFSVTTSDDGYWYCTAKDIAPRSFDTLYFDNDVDQKIKDHLDQWLKTKPIFTERGLNFKTGILLYGSPGTGKSSIATAIATYLKCDMIIIDTSSFGNLKIAEVTNSIDADDDMYVVLLDEVDALFKSRDDEKSDDAKQKESDKLLSFLDSQQSPNNVVFVATTNYIDNLDQAVRRKGRFDKEFEILDISLDTARRMCKGFNLDADTTEEIIESRSKDDKQRINPADLQVEILSRMKINNMNYDNDAEVLTSVEAEEKKEAEEKAKFDYTGESDNKEDTNDEN